MRISIDDPGHWDKCALRPEGAPHIRILLDGVEQENATSANEEAGEVTRYKVDENGGVIASGGFIESETVHGKVQIILPDWWPK